MPTQRIAFACVIATFLLFSCNNKKNKTNIAINDEPVTRYDTVNVLPDEPVNIGAFNAGFTSSVTQRFTVEMQKVSVITASKGLRVTVNPSALLKEDGSPVDGKINVSVIELTNSDDLFKSNAATLSDGRLLSSGGSYFIGMECNGQKLHVKDGNSLKMEFPKLQDNEMELFYGNRNTDGDMNWVKADEPLSFDRYGSYTVYKPPYPDTETRVFNKSRYFLFESLDSKVIYLNTKMTVREMVSLLQKKGIDKNIDSVNISLYGMEPADRRGNYFDRLPRLSWKRYRVLSCQEQQAEHDSLAKARQIRDQRDSANRRYLEEWEKTNDENSLTGQLKKYYAPSSITKLGWINCDRFYNGPQNTEILLNIPITLNKPQIEYFLIYKSINGLMNGRLTSITDSTYRLTNLPEGLEVTLVAFTKSNGQLFHCSEEFVIRKNKPVRLNFKNISPEEMTNMFGKNVRI